MVVRLVSMFALNTKVEVQRALLGGIINCKIQFWAVIKIQKCTCKNYVLKRYYIYLRTKVLCVASGVKWKLKNFCTPEATHDTVWWAVIFQPTTHTFYRMSERRNFFFTLVAASIGLEPLQQRQVMCCHTSLACNRSSIETDGETVKIEII